MKVTDLGCIKIVGTYNSVSDYKDSLKKHVLANYFTLLIELVDLYL